jgi:acylphosphatase
MAAAKKARRFLVSGRVQGVGYRYFAQQTAESIGVRGYAQNLDNGDVEVYASGTKEQLDRFAQRLAQGPRLADVRNVEQHEETMLDYDGFHIKA